jgi:iron complex transport system ATP-binding protein
MSKPAEDNIISLDRFSIGHQKGNALLSQLNLAVNRGEMVALIGRNGAGKSTLLKSMIGLLAPLGGVCLLDGRPFNEYSLTERSRKVSFVSSQLTQLPSITVEELVGLGRMPYTGWIGRLTSKDRLLIEKALDEVQLGSFADRKLECLSDGERQRAMIARAFVQDTPLMVLDEPTAFLDIPNTFELIRLLNRFRNQGKTIIYSTHNLETAMQCADKMWVIHENIIREGAPEDLGLSGLFNDIFSSSGILYNEQLRRFLIKAELKGSVHVEGGREDQLTWTRNAAERLGYRVEKSADIKITAESSVNGMSWIVQKEGMSVRFENLYTMARFLMKE